MRRPSEIAADEASMATLAELTNAFEGIASMRISHIKNQVLQSTRFFQELWQIYTQLRVDTDFRFGREQTVTSKVIDKELYIVITSEGGLSGDIDHRLVQTMLPAYDPDKHDIVVIGRHGATQLTQHGVTYKKYFELPHRDRNIDATPITQLVEQYRTTTMFYPKYVSLMNQQVRRIELMAVVKERGKTSDKPEEIISEDTYIFEPSVYTVVAHLERSMMQIAISQLVLESKLAQYASRFRAMSASHERAETSRGELHLDYNRAQRHIKDERLKEIVNGLKKTRRRTA